MNVYVLGAGVSRCVGYPVGDKLFDEIDEFIRDSGKAYDRFDYNGRWPELLNWLDKNGNPLIVQAYRTRNIEHLFTVLDFASEIREGAFSNAVRTPKGSADRSSTFTNIEAFDAQIREYQECRRILLWALEHYFAWRHYEDLSRSKEKGWDTLRTFADRIEPGDVVITFNYDATIERVLLEQKMWSPSNGFGFELVLQESRFDKRKVESINSSVVVLHLHGATGWYRRPAFAPGFVLPSGSGGAISIEAFGPAPLNTKISLDPQFLQSLGIFNVDACLPDTLPVADESHVVLHPSFLKDYETDGSDSHVFIELWQRAAEEIRRAEHTYIVGYSLPKADVAVMTLLLTNVRQGCVTVVNPDKHTVMRLGRLFHSNPFGPALTLEQWLASRSNGPVASSSLLSA